MSHPVTDAAFSKEVIEHNGFVLVDFWAEWCGPCKQLAPLLDELSQEMGDKIKVLKMNVDENPDIPSKFGIRGIPTMIIFKDGQKISTKVGSLPKSALLDWVNSEIA